MRSNSMMHVFQLLIPATLIFFVGCQKPATVDQTNPTGTAGNPSGPKGDTTAKATVKGFQGSVEAVNCKTISGWAYDGSDPDGAAKVQISVDGKAVGTATANISRPDLISAGYGNGKHGFSFKLPAKLGGGASHKIRAKIQGAPGDLHYNVPNTVSCTEAPSGPGAAKNG